MKTVLLTKEEILRADSIAKARQEENLAKGRSDRYGAEKGEDGLDLHVRGARGECAVAKMLGIEWTGNLSDLKAADVGPFQVRTAAESHHRLILHPQDEDSDTFFFVVARSPKFDVVGWTKALDGKKDQFWSDPAGNGRAAFFVPQRVLQPLSDL